VGQFKYWHIIGFFPIILPYNNFSSDKPMTYTITKHIKIEHEEDGWSFDFTTDECGTVSIEDGNGPGFQTIHIPKDCIQHFIDVLEQYK
jgi:hypothetical protein